jgi:hypothetical protein
MIVWLAITLPLLLLVGWGALQVWDRLCGNYPARFYGRVVDASGVGVPDVEVTFEIIYSPTPRVPLGPERIHQVAVRSDRVGNFQLDGVSGYSLRIASVSHLGQPIGLKAMQLPDSADPGAGLRLGGGPTRRVLPDTPNKRVLYRIVKLEK